MKTNQNLKWDIIGPIIERENIEVFRRDEKWYAYSQNSDNKDYFGNSAIEAIYKCYKGIIKNR